MLRTPLIAGLGMVVMFQGFSEHPKVPDFEQLAQGIGLCRLDLQSLSQPGEGRLCLRLKSSVLQEYAWRDTEGGGGQSLSPIDCVSEYLQEEPRKDTQLAPWMSRNRPSVWIGGTPQLLLGSPQSSGAAKGVLRLERQALGIATGQGRLFVEEVTSGCFFQPEFSLPQEIGKSGLDLAFVWDLHSQVSPESLYLNMKIAGQWMQPVPIVSSADLGPALHAPRFLELYPGESAQMRVSLERGSRVLLEGVDVPQCLEIVDRSMDEFGTVLTVASKEDAVWHACGPVVLSVLVDGDPVGYAREVYIKHRPSLGARSVMAIGAPGEAVELWSNSTGVVVTYPQRLSCLSGWYRAQGLALLGSLIIPSEEPLLFALPFAGGVQSGVLMPTGEGPERLFERWRLLCAQ